MFADINELQKAGLTNDSKSVSRPCCRLAGPLATCKRNTLGQLTEQTVD